MILNVPRIGASFDKINLTMRHKKQRPCRHRTASKSRVPGYARHSPRLPLPTTTPPNRPGQGPARPYGGGPVHFSLDGGWAVEYPPAGANAGQRCHFRGRCFWGTFTFGGVGSGSRSFWRMAGPSASILPHTFNSRRRILMD